MGIRLEEECSGCHRTSMQRSEQSRCTCGTLRHGWPRLEFCKGCERRLIEDEFRWCQDCCKLGRWDWKEGLTTPPIPFDGCLCQQCEAARNPKRPIDSDVLCGYFIGARWWLAALAVMGWAIWLVTRRGN